MGKTISDLIRDSITVSKPKVDAPLHHLLMPKRMHSGCQIPVILPEEDKEICKMVSRGYGCYVDECDEFADIGFQVTWFHDEVITIYFCERHAKMAVEEIDEDKNTT